MKKRKYIFGVDSLFILCILFQPFLGIAHPLISYPPRLEDLPESQVTVDFYSTNFLTPNTFQELERMKEFPFSLNLKDQHEVIKNRGIAILSSFPRIRALNLSYNPIVDEEIEHLVSLPLSKSITTLNLYSATHITDNAVEHLNALKRLRELDLGDSKITNLGLQHLKKNVALNKLKLESNSRITLSGITHLAGLIKLEELYLHHIKPDPPNLVPIDPRKNKQSPFSHLQKLRQLQVLYLQNSNVQDSDLFFIRELPKLTTLNLSLNQITSEGGTHFSTLEGLHTLDLSHNKDIDDNIFLHLKKCKNLQELNLEGTEITISPATKIEPEKIQSLNLRSTKITDSSLIEIAKLPKLSTLNLMGNSEITDEGLRNLLPLSKSLTSLELHHQPNITDSGMKHIAKLSNLKNLFLESLNGVTDAGLQELKNLKELRTLHVSLSTTNKGLAFLGTLTKLESLRLVGRESKFTDQGLIHLQQLTNLKVLNLSHNRTISDEGLFNLKIPSLRFLNLDGTNIECISYKAITQYVTDNKNITKVVFPHYRLSKDYIDAEYRKEADAILRKRQINEVATFLEATLQRRWLNE